MLFLILSLAFKAEYLMHVINMVYYVKQAFVHCIATRLIMW